MVGCYWHFPRVFFWSIIDLDGKDGHKSAAPVEQSDFQRIKLQPAEWCDSLIPMRFTQRFRFEQHTPFHVLVEHDFFHLPNNVWQYWIKWHFCDCTFMVSWSIAIWQSVTFHVQIHQHITYITTLSFHFGSKHFLKTWSMDEVRDAWSGYVHGNHPDSFVAREHPGPSWTILDHPGPIWIDTKWHQASKRQLWLLTCLQRTAGVLVRRCAKRIKKVSTDSTDSTELLKWKDVTGSIARS